MRTASQGSTRSFPGAANPIPLVPLACSSRDRLVLVVRTHIVVLHKIHIEIYTFVRSAFFLYQSLPLR